MGCWAIPLPIRVGNVAGEVQLFADGGDSMGPRAGTFAAVKRGRTLMSGYRSSPPSAASDEPASAAPALPPAAKPAAPPVASPADAALPDAPPLALPAVP